MDFTPRPTDLLVVIDVQEDFLEGGALAVPDGDSVLPVIHDLAPRFDNIVLTQDWHPAGHSSFASMHDGKAPFDTIEMPYGIQVLWPDHCIQGDPGAEIRAPLSAVNRAQMIIRKGCNRETDSYSAFLENNHLTPTGLAGFMRERGLGRAVFVGLALDYCVGFSALDARKLGFEATVILDGCRGIDEESVQDMIGKMRAAGVTIA